MLAEESAKFAQSRGPDYPIPNCERLPAPAAALAYRHFGRRGVLMPRNLRPFAALLACLLLPLSALAQVPGVQWQQDIESAKVLARDSGRLVLVHVVSDGCGPCRALESNVFAQPGVAGAIEQRFVPVRLNANEYPAIAQGFGITRVPTDVILTPDGQILSKAISPATPSAYIAETTNVANKYASQLGQQYNIATASPPNPAVLNQAYADLAIGAPPQAAPSVPMNTVATPGTANGAFAPPSAPMNTPVPSTVTNSYAPINNYAPPATPSYATPQQPVTPIPSNPAADPYASYAPPTQHMQTPAQQQLPQLAPPAQTSQFGYEPPASPAANPAMSAPSFYNPPVDSSVPPSNPSGPVSEEAQRPAVTQQASAAVPDPSKLPPGAPPLGFDGYCPVTMRTGWKWIPGDPAYGAIHRGRTYWFAGAAEQKQFLSNPDYYGPALSGIDPVLAIDHQQSVPGLREHSLDYDGQFYMFSSEATLQQFTSGPERYASGVRQAMGLAPTQQTR
jgi:YHS domain-containing protein/thiol-disulfide isomerase/thioredoxin